MLKQREMNTKTGNLAVPRMRTHLLIATSSPDSLLFPISTLPYVPSPNCLMVVYRFILGKGDAAGLFTEISSSWNRNLNTSLFVVLFLLVATLATGLSSLNMALP